MKSFIIHLQSFIVEAESEEEARQKANMDLYKRLKPTIEDIEPFE